MNDLLQKCESLLPDALGLWEKLVNIDTGSGDTEGLRTLAGILEDRLTGLGFTVARYPAKGENSEYNIVAVKEGTGKKTALLMAHMDTVFPRGTVAERPFTINGEWAHGPGVSDCKGGIVVILEAMKLLHPEDYKRITILFNCDEEITSPSSMPLLQELGAQHDFALSYEPSSAVDSVCVARKSNAKIKVSAFGKNSHAGSAPEQGINALRELVWQVDRMQELGDPQKLTTVVFTKFVSGDRINVVPDKAEAWADVRVFYPEELDRLEQEIHCLVSEQVLPDSRVEAILIRNRPPFPQNESTQALAEKAQEIYRELGRDLTPEQAGGVGDINFVYGTGAACLCRLGPVGGGPNHTAEEKNHIPSIPPRIYLSVRLIRELCR